MVRNIVIRLRRAWAFWRGNGTIAFVRLVLQKGRAVLLGRPLFNPVVLDAEQSPVTQVRKDVVSAPALFEASFPNLRPLKTYVIPTDGRRRLTLVTDSISKGSLFGGVGTALILGVQLANRLNATLRILTRTEPAPPENVAHVLAVYGVQPKHEITFTFASVDDRRQEVEIFPDELFLTTSWWTTAATLPAVSVRNIVYLLQEDERMFYPYGDERFMCERVLARSDIRFVVNTRLLFEHLAESGLPNITRSAVWFEPAFPASVFRPQPRSSGHKRRFFFYARPGNARNLFFLGVNVIHRAVERGVLDPREWDICFVGKHIPPVQLPGGVPVQRLEELDWAEYASFIGGVDLALSLMYTPHPSYPPLDVAASGGIVVTNRHGRKQELSSYSGNILCVDCDPDALVQGLRDGAAMARSPIRAANFAQGGLGRSWDAALRSVIDKVVGDGCP